MVRSPHPSGPASRIRNPLDPRNPLAGVYLATVLFELAEAGLRFLVPLNLNDRGLGPEAIGIVIAVFSLASLLSRGVAAALFRPERARWLILAAGLASTFAYLLTPFVTSLPLFAMLMAFDGFGWGVATTCLLAVMMVSTPLSMSPAVAMGWLVGFQGIAMALATIVGGLLAERFGIQDGMLILATVPVRLPRPERDVEAVPAEGDSDEPMMPATRGRLATGIHGVRSLVAAVPAPVWTAALVALYLNVMNGIVQSFFPLLALGLGFSIVQIGTLSSVRSAASAVARFGAAWIFERLPARVLHLPLLTTSALTVALLPSVGSHAVDLPLFAANGVSRGLLRVTTGAAAMASLRGNQAGTAAAMMTAGLDVGKLVGPLLGGFLAAAVGLEWMFRIVPISFLALYAAAHLVGARRRVVRAAGVPPS